MAYNEGCISPGSRQLEPLTGLRPLESLPLLFSSPNATTETTLPASTESEQVPTFKAHTGAEPSRRCPPTPPPPCPPCNPPPREPSLLSPHSQHRSRLTRPGAPRSHHSPPTVQTITEAKVLQPMAPRPQRPLPPRTPISDSCCGVTLPSSGEKQRTRPGVPPQHCCSRLSRGARPLTGEMRS